MDKVSVAFFVQKNLGSDEKEETACIVQKTIHAVC